MRARSLIKTIAPSGVVTLTINRPERHNAFDGGLIGALLNHLEVIQEELQQRVLVLTGSGRSFCSGADLDWLRKGADPSPESEPHDSQALELAALLKTLQRFPMATIARVNGPAYGGGLGLMACCDVAVATSAAHFAFTETRLGLVPAIIAPYVVAAIGARAARRLFLSSESISAVHAQELGLVNRVVSADSLDAAVASQVQRFLRAGPRAVGECKALIDRIAPIDPQVVAATTDLFTRLRSSAEAEEGIRAFFERRAPSWAPPRDEAGP